MVEVLFGELNEMFDVEGFTKGDRKELVYEGFDVKGTIEEQYDCYFDKFKEVITKTYS